MASNMQSIQEMAAEFANNFLASLNATVAETIGVDVMWFRATPDVRSQDVIFQNYTLFGVENCPLTFKAVYCDNSYDDAAITYNIMGLEYSVPLSLEIAVNTWYEVTQFDGTLPQRGDIVFIPISNKLLEVVSMTPVKKLGAQLTSFKVNLSIYKPTRSRIVGENLRTSIEESTVNLKSQFGEDIDETFKNIVDESQLSIFNTTSVDRDKKNAITNAPDSIMLGVNNIIESNLNIEGHLVSRSYYDLAKGGKFTVKYTSPDRIRTDSVRCLSCWFRMVEPPVTLTNISEMTLVENKLTVKTNKHLTIGTDVIISRGSITIPGTVISEKPYIIALNEIALKKLNETTKSWNALPGYTIEASNTVGILNSEGENTISMSVKSGKFISCIIDGNETVFRLPQILTTEKWYGCIINIGERVSIDIFTENEKFENIIHMENLRNKFWKELSVNNYYIPTSAGYLTNIRLYDTANTEIDKQIMDLLTYNIPNDSHAIVNDSVDIYMDKKFTGIKG